MFTFMLFPFFCLAGSGRTTGQAPRPFCTAGKVLVLPTGFGDGSCKLSSMLVMYENLCWPASFGLGALHLVGSASRKSCALQEQRPTGACESQQTRLVRYAVGLLTRDERRLCLFSVLRMVALGVYQSTLNWDVSTRKLKARTTWGGHYRLISYTSSLADEESVSLPFVLTLPAGGGLETFGGGDGNQMSAGQDKV